VTKPRPHAEGGAFAVVSTSDLVEHLVDLLLDAGER
jgi:hypothetical protein